MSFNELFAETVFAGFSFAEKHAAMTKHLTNTKHVMLFAYSWEFYQAVRKAFSVKSQDVSIIGSEWLDYRFSRKGNSSLYGAPDILSETTYRDCVTVVANLVDLTVEITMSDGDFCNGKPTDRRCKWNVKLSEAFAETHLQALIDNRLLSEIGREDEREQARIKAERMRVIFVESFIEGKAEIAE
ncbi:hypothetical protein RYA05_02425 [Pseudomonas syringae pv. actinidiae]|nr:hypothetical protein [Pseudomonas syringae pv. actinidiae]